MVPPTLSEMGKDVLPGKFNDLVKQLPEMKNIEISNNKRWEEPVNTMYHVVVVEVAYDVVVGKVAVIIIGVLTFRHCLV